MVMTGKHKCRLEFLHKLGKDRDAHDANPPGRLTPEGFVHEKDIRVGVASHCIHVFPVEVPGTVTGEWLCLVEPGRCVIPRKSDHADPCAGHDVSGSREEVMAGDWRGASIFFGGEKVPVLVVPMHPDKWDFQVTKGAGIVVWVEFSPGFPCREIADLK